MELTNVSLSLLDPPAVETGMTPMTTVEKARARIDAVLSDLQPKKAAREEEDATGIDTEKWRALLRESIIQSDPSAAAGGSRSAGWGEWEGGGGGRPWN